MQLSSSSYKISASESVVHPYPRPASHLAVDSCGNGKLCGMLTWTVTLGLYLSVVHRYVVGKVRQTTTDIKHARTHSYMSEKKIDHISRISSGFNGCRSMNAWTIRHLWSHSKYGSVGNRNCLENYWENLVQLETFDWKKMFRHTTP